MKKVLADVAQAAVELLVRVTRARPPKPVKVRPPKPVPKPTPTPTPVEPLSGLHDGDGTVLLDARGRSLAPPKKRKGDTR